MEKSVWTKEKIGRWILRVALSIACVAMMVFIFSNSLKTGEQSSAQSSTVVQVVQEVAAVVAPNSGIATATGEAYVELHSVIRTLAHFSEFALLGALFCWCCLSYTDKKIFMLLPLCGVAVVPMLDEWLQTFTSARAAEWKDVLTDISGGLCGVAFALVCVMIGAYIYRRIMVSRRKRLACAATEKRDKEA